MTKQTDALNAFSGVLQALERSTYEEGFVWALPKPRPELGFVVACSIRLKKGRSLSKLELAELERACVRW